MPQPDMRFFMKQDHLQFFSPKLLDHHRRNSDSRMKYPCRKGRSRHLTDKHLLAADIPLFHMMQHPVKIAALSNDDGRTDGHTQHIAISDRPAYHAEIVPPHKQPAHPTAVIKQVQLPQKRNCQKYPPHHSLQKNLLSQYPSAQNKHRSQYRK